MKVKHKILLIGLTVLLLALLAFSGCTGAAKSRGWAGGSVQDGTLFVGSMAGRIIAIDPASGSILEPSIPLLIQTSGGLSCGCGGNSVSSVILYASPVVHGTVVYVGGMDGRIYAYSFIENKLRETAEWIFPRQGSMKGEVVGGITIANDILYFATSDGRVYALKADGLYEEWSVDISDKIWSAPVIDGDTLYVGTLDRKIVAMNIADGSTKWERETVGAISSMPVVFGDKVYIGDYDRQFYAFDITTGEIVWQFPSDGKNPDNPKNWFWATPVIVNGIIYAPCLDGNVYMLDADTGNLIKKIVLGDSISSSPVVMGDSIVVATTDLYKKTGKVYIIDTQNNSQRELASFDEGINAPLFYNNDVVYVHTTKDTLYGINIINGTRQTFSLSDVK